MSQSRLIRSPRQIRVCLDRDPIDPDMVNRARKALEQARESLSKAEDSYWKSLHAKTAAQTARALLESVKMRRDFGDTP